jgi:hypothetical protein
MVKAACVFDQEERYRVDCVYFDEGTPLWFRITLLKGYHGPPRFRFYSHKIMIWDRRSLRTRTRARTRAKTRTRARRSYNEGPRDYGHGHPTRQCVFLKRSAKRQHGICKMPFRLAPKHNTNMAILVYGDRSESRKDVGMFSSELRPWTYNLASCVW